MKERLSQRLKIYTAVSSIWCLTKQRLVESTWLRCLYCRITDWLNEFIHLSKIRWFKIRLTKKSHTKCFECTEYKSRHWLPWKFWMAMKQEIPGWVLELQQVLSAISLKYDRSNALLENIACKENGSLLKRKIEACSGELYLQI